MRRKLVLLVTLTTLIACEARQWPPLAASDRDAVSDALGILECGAQANNQTAEAFEPSIAVFGEVFPVEAVACTRSLFDRMQIQAVPLAEIGTACQGTADACTLPDHSGCGRDIIRFPQERLPHSLLGSSDGTPETTAGFFARTMYHESIHTMQSGRFEGCDPSGTSYEPEAYAQEIQFSGWLVGQIRLIDPGNPDTTSRPCDHSLDQAVAAGFDPCLNNLIRRVVPDLDGSAILDDAHCDDVRFVSRGASAFVTDRLASFTMFNDVLRSRCVARMALESPVQVPSRRYQIRTAAGIGSLVQFAVSPDGSPSVLNTFRLSLDTIDDLLIRNADGSDQEHIVVAGTRAGVGHVIILRDSDSPPEFPEDGIFDTVVADLTAPTFRSGSQLALGADHVTVYVWDRAGQRAFRLTDTRTAFGAGPDGVPDGILPTAILSVPAGRSGTTLSFAPDAPLAFVATGRTSVEQQGLVFEDDDRDGRYEYSTSGDATAAGVVPPTLMDVPTATAQGLWVSCQSGHLCQIVESDAVGRLGAVLGADVGDASSLVRIALDRPLVPEEYIRLSDVDAGLEGPFVPVLGFRFQAFEITPSVVRTAGGDVLHVRGGGFASLTSVTVGGVAATFSVIDDGHLEITTPPLPVGVARVVLSNGQKQHRDSVGSVRASQDPSRELDTAAVFGGLTLTGLGWRCGSVLAGSAVPPSLDPGGCLFHSVVGGFGFATTAPIDVTEFQGRPLVLELTHHAAMGTLGDGAIVQARVPNGPWITLSPIGSGVAEIDSASCVDLPQHVRACMPDSELHGLLGFSHEFGDTPWRHDRFELPATLTNVQIRFGATQFGTTEVLWAIDAMHIGVEEFPAPATTPASDLREPLLACRDVATSGGFRCTVDRRAQSTVLEFGTRPAKAGRATIPVDMTRFAPGTSLVVELRHQFDFRTGALVNGAGGWAEMCCGHGRGQCVPITPVDGYPGHVGGGRPAFTDEGVERVEQLDRFDVSSMAGDACELVFYAKSKELFRASGWRISGVDLVAR